MIFQKQRKVLIVPKKKTLLEIIKKNRSKRRDNLNTTKDIVIY